MDGDFNSRWKRLEQEFEAAEQSTNRMIKISFCAAAVFLLLLFILMGAAIVWIVSNL